MASTLGCINTELSQVIMTSNNVTETVTTTTTSLLQTCTHVSDKGKSKGQTCGAPAKIDNLCKKHLMNKHARAVRAATAKGLPPPAPPDFAGAAALAAAGPAPAPVCLPCGSVDEVGPSVTTGGFECCYVFEKGKIKGSKCTAPSKLKGMCETHVLLLHERAAKAAVKAGREPPPKPDLAAALADAFTQAAAGDAEDPCKGLCKYTFTQGKTKGQRCKILAKSGGLCTKHAGSVHKRAVSAAEKASVEAPPPPDLSQATRNRHLCSARGCEANVTFGFVNTPATRCEAHREPGTRWMLKSLCRCGRRPHYGFLTDEWATCCKDCAPDGMVNVADDRCPCERRKIPSFAFPGMPAIRCSACAEDGMVDVMSMKCLGCNLPNGPAFGLPGDAIGRYCGGCKTPEMVNLKHDRCVVCDVTISPSFGYPFDERPTACHKCKTNYMVNLKHLLCPCGSVASFGNPGDEHASNCKRCATEGMVDIRHPRCNNDNCNIAANFKHSGYCFRCFIEAHPDSGITLNYRTKEFAVVDYIKAQFPEIKLTLNKSVGSSKRRPDILIILPTHVVIIEVDEHRHCCYGDEAQRLAQLYDDLGGTKPMQVVRFNPDGYIEAGTNHKVKSCWGANTEQVFGVVTQHDWDERLNTLKGVVQSCIDNVPTRPIAEHRLFYGGHQECDTSDEEVVEVQFESLGLN